MSRCRLMTPELAAVLDASEHSAAWNAERQRIAEEGNRKRGEAARARNRKPDGTLSSGPVHGQSVRVQEVTRPAKASQSRTNPGAVARGDKLARERPSPAGRRAP